jgi:hypothetical protein
VTISFNVPTFGLILIGQYELGEIAKELALVFANFAHRKNHASLGRNRPDVREYSTDRCEFILI